MRSSLALSVVLAITFAAAVRGGDWLTAPSFYTHDPRTGMRTNQYAPPPPAVVPQAADFSTSGYTHLRSSIQVGQSADNYHRVEKWGPPVRPYGEWRFPYRPYSVPYGLWGAPLAGLNIGSHAPPYGHPGHGYPPGRDGYGGPDGEPGHGYPGGVSGHGGYRPTDPNQPYPYGPDTPYPVPPHADGYYPSVPFRPRLNDERFFEQPTLDSPPPAEGP